MRLSLRDREPGTCNSTDKSAITIRLAARPRHHEDEVLRGLAEEAVRRLRGGRDALLQEHLDHVADLDVVEALEADAALEPGLDLAHVVLEAAERSDLAFVDD